MTRAPRSAGRPANDAEVGARAGRDLAGLRRWARALQRELEQYYRLPRGPSVAPYIALAGAGEREQVLVRQGRGAVELRVVLPTDPGAGTRRGVHDHFLQVAEGVSHFVLLSERARVDLPATLLELELQAEVDKFVLLTTGQGGEARALHRRLFDAPRFLHEAGTALGDRYRLAHRLAARFTEALLPLGPSARQGLLARFYRQGQADKISLASAA